MIGTIVKNWKTRRNACDAENYAKKKNLTAAGFVLAASFRMTAVADSWSENETKKEEHMIPNRENVLRKTNLTDDQFERLCKYKSTEKQIGRVLAAILEELGDKMSEKEELFWSTVHELMNVDIKKETASVDWINRCVVVYKKNTSAN